MMETKKKKLFMVSLGCSKNQVDSEVMLGRLKEYEITSELSEADAVIVKDRKSVV